MTVDFLLFRTDRTIRSPSELVDRNTQPLGACSHVRAQLDAAIPDVVWTRDDGRGHLLGHELQLCVLSGNEDVRFLCVRAAAEASPAIAELARRLQLVPFDSTRGVLVTD